MKKRLGNFLLLFGLISLVLFFSSPAFTGGSVVYLFAGVGLSSLGMLLKRDALPKRDKQDRKSNKSKKKPDRDTKYD